MKTAMRKTAMRKASRTAASWLAERARFISSLVGLTDEQFNTERAPGKWTYRRVAKHLLSLEQDSLKQSRQTSGARPARTA
jgi:hypothetical protein